MKKNWKRMLSLLLAVCMTAGLLVLPAAADESEEPVEPGEVTKFNVTFEAVDAEGTALTVEDLPANDEVEENGKVTLAESLTLEGYTFVNWTKDEGEDAVTGEQTITADTKFVAHFTKNADPNPPEETKFNVTFEAVDAEGTALTVEGMPANDEVEENGKVTLPESLTLEGYTFVNWTKGEGEDAVTGEQTITDNTKFVAHFTKNADPNPPEETKFNVTFEAVDAEGTALTVEGMPANDEVEENGKVTLPESLTLEGYTFAKWTKDDGTDAVTGEQTITDNTKFVAHFTKNVDPTPSVDKTALNAAIDAAEKLADVVGSADGKDVEPAKEWVATEKRTALDTALAEARALAADAAQEDVTAAAEKLAAAVKDVTDNKAPGTKVDKSALDAAITAAEAAKTGVEVDTEAANVPVGTQWVTQEEMDALEAAIAVAQGVADTATTQDEVDGAVTTLNDAVETFKTARKPGEKPLGDDELKTALAEAITAANTAKEGVVANDATDPAEVDKGTKYVPSAVMTALEDALQAAEDLKALLDDEDAENDPAAEDLTDALVALKNATNDFQPKTGTKEEEPPVTEEYTVTVEHGAGGEASADKAKAAAGEEVTLTITPNSGYEVDAITVTATNGAPVTVSGNKFTMPASNVTVTVTFKAESGEEPEPSGEPFDVVPGNLGQIDDDSDLPANGLAIGYTATAVKTGEGAVTVTLKADALFEHLNANDVKGFWIGFGMPIEGETGEDAYTYCLVTDGEDGDPIGSVPGRVQTVGDKNYNTIYFKLDAADAGKTQTVVVKQTKLADNTAITYTVNITVDELTDPLTKALNEAYELRSTTKTSADGSDISTSDKWVPLKMMDDLYDAYKEAEQAKNGTEAERVAAAAKLNAAIATFKAAMQDGSKSGGSGRPAIGSGTSAGGGSGGSTSNNVVDKTSETLADGTKRDTETLADGTVTVTETWPNGTKTVTTTTPDGELTTDVTLGSGVKSATVAIPVKDAGNGTVAMIVKDDGTEEVIRGSMVEDGNVVFQLDKDAKVKIVNNAKRFVDIGTHWAKDYVDYVTAREFFNGVDATHFSPDTAMTRAMLATVLYRLVGETNVDGAASYKDVAANTWYTDAVNWASKVGVVNGYPDGTFAPNRAITREELVVMFYRYAGSPAVDDRASLVAYQDADQVSSWAETAMRWAVSNGIINGKSVDTLLPRGNATRAEVSAVLQRYVNLTK